MIEAVLISNAMGIVGNILPILQRLKQFDSNFEEADRLLERLHRLHDILSEMATESYSRITFSILQALNHKLIATHEFLVNFEKRNFILKFALADNYKDKFIGINDDLYKLVNELIVCSTMDIKRNSNEVKGILEVLISQISILNQSGIESMLNDKIPGLSDKEMTALKSKLMNTKSKSEPI
eukprot:NODE_310_length_10051_cov_0.839228.p6 type:complete len:182 gc:universal NODE_310_length_10051_cov_0.839228:9594-9049(-)